MIKILIVDDSEIHLEGMKTILKTLGKPKM